MRRAIWLGRSPKTLSVLTAPFRTGVRVAIVVADRKATAPSPSASVLERRIRTKLQVLRDHSDVTSHGIRSTIAGTVTLPRNGIVSQANEALAETQVIALTGPPGSGKSALAKAVVQWQANDHVCLSFRAEEFAESHIDRVLQGQPTGRQLETLLAAQERVLLHVESLERLLEHPTRDASRLPWAGRGTAPGRVSEDDPLCHWYGPSLNRRAYCNGGIQSVIL